MTKTLGGKLSNRTDGLFTHAAALGNFSSAMIVLAELMPDRTTTSQAVFFLLAASADIAGKPATFTSIQEEAGDVIGKSLHTTYRVFLDGAKRKDAPTRNGLGWLKAIADPNNLREKPLTLTPVGRAIMAKLVQTLGT
jgi:hypothetical protein